MRQIIRFGRHKGTGFGHIIERKRCGHPARFRNRRLKVQLIEGRWIDENGRDVNSEITEAITRAQTHHETNNRRI